MISKGEENNSGEPVEDSASDLDTTWSAFAGDSGVRSSTAKLLALGLDDEASPFALLLETLRAMPGPNTLTEILVNASGKSPVAVEKLLAGGQASLEDLGALKRKSVTIARVASDEPVAQSGLYFVTIAAGLAHHDTKLTSQPSDVLENALLDLGAATADPWSALCVKAVERLHEIN